MAIRQKPQTIEDERRVEALIEKGGSVAIQGDRLKQQQFVQLRLSPELVERIDRTRKLRTVPPSRHAWILEAILNEIQKSES